MTIPIDKLTARLGGPGHTMLAGAPEGLDALLLAETAESRAGRPILHVCRDDARLARMISALRFFAPGLEVLALPAWDCVPYDRVSPNGDILARRLDTLTRLAAAPEGERIVVSTVSAVLQRIPAREAFTGAILSARIGDQVAQEALMDAFARNGYRRAGTVREPGEYAIRGGIVDVYPPGSADPIRLDFFGDELENVRDFDAMTQRSTGTSDGFILKPVSEILLDEESIRRFRNRYREMFGAADGNDPLYETVSAGRRHIGMEHWLALFHERLETLFDYLPEAAVTFDHQADGAVAARLNLIAEHYETRQAMRSASRRDALADGAPVYKPVPPESLFITDAEWRRLLDARPTAGFTPFGTPAVTASAVDAGGGPVPDFADARRRADVNLFDAVRERIAAETTRPVLIAAQTLGARDRLGALLREHGVALASNVERWEQVQAQPGGTVSMAVLDIDRGFQFDGALVLGEQDILGDRLARPARKRRRAEQFIAEISTLSQGDLVVHVDHGIGRYDGLEPVMAGGAPHDCLRVLYAGGDKLFVPVENIDALSRYGAEEGEHLLDRLGGAAWQARKAKIKQRIREVAEQLLKTAAERALRRGESLEPTEGAFEEFCARFSFAETEDQLRAIEDTLSDLASGKPMDRLICGDVGFGKTEVALRAAFVAAMNGQQVAMVVPTTLLARQHYQTFSERFAGLPVRIAQLSRLVAGKNAAAVKEGLADGSIDIVVGTHALLAKSVSFGNLGLLIIDEEQHFGVGQKERLKQLKANVHILTLTATPIPRTLQMALTGVREMSIIATPPVDRLAVRTFVLPYDPVIVREAIQRERFRGGQTFYVCPRISDLDRVRNRVTNLAPEAKVAVAHGQMPTGDLEAVMTAFCDGRYDVLITTNIIEAGLDIPTANTMVIHRADRFGLAQLYQLRGRIGRSKTRAYAYLTLPPGQVLSETAKKRLEVMQALDTLGAGFTLASHDLDIRGAGNLLGEEQSGHVKEIGVELYQQMLEEAVASLKGEEAGRAAAEQWTPQIAIGTSVLIPENYVQDLPVRLGLYRRLSLLVEPAEIEAFAAELIDRFGPLPQEVDNLLQIVAIKRLCREAGIEKIDAGPKGVVIAFRDNSFANPAGLIGFIQKEYASVRMRSDHRLVYTGKWTMPQTRIAGVRRIVGELAKVAAAA